MPRINPTVSKKAKEIYESLDHHIRGKFVSEAIEEKHNKESNPFTEEQQKVIDALKEEIEKLKEDIKAIEDWSTYITRNGRIPF